MKKIIALPFLAWFFVLEAIVFVLLVLAAPANIVLDWLEDE